MKSSLNLIWLTLVFLFQTSYVYSQSQAAIQLQELSIQPDNTPESYFKKGDSLMNILYGYDSSESGPRASFERYRTFFHSRSKPVFNNEHLSKAYIEALQNARGESESGCGNEDDFKGSWKNIGPRTDNILVQNQGWVSCIWSSPSNLNLIIIGTEAGGVWKSINGGTDWTNITDGTPLNGTMGIQALAVNPNNYNEMYVATRMGPKTPYGGPMVGLGIWHTTNGGTSWTLETNGLTNPDLIKAQAIEFSPYLVNGQDFVVATIDNRVFAKRGSNSWVDLSPNTIQNPANQFSDHFTDIEFMPDNQGEFLIANEWDNIYSQPAIYKVVFNMTNGGFVSNPTVLIDKFLNSNVYAVSCTTSVLDVLSFQVEYMGNNKIYIAANVAQCTEPYWQYKTHIFETSLLSPNTITLLLSDIIAPWQYHDIGLEASLNEDIMYFSNNNANLIYKHNGTWKWKAIGGYSGPSRKIHSDIRSINFIKDVVSTNGVGSDHIVLWGSDGGISRTSLHDISAIIYHNNSTGENGVCLDENLNGNNLYLGDLWDADSEPFGKAYSSAGWHNGFQYYNKASDLWSGFINGDGENANFDKRMSNGTNFTLIEKGLIDVNQHPNPGAAIISTGLGIGQPENPWWFSYSPMQYREDKMNLGIVRAWESNSSNNVNPYFNGASSPDFDLDDAPNNLLTEPIYLRWYNEKRRCLQFIVSPSNPNRAYYLLDGAKLPGLLSRGVNTGSGWNWVDGPQNNLSMGSDITPPIMSNTTNGFMAHEFCVDPKNENRVFLAIGGVNWGSPATNRVLVTNDGGGTWTDMSAGLTELPVNCIVYQNGSDDILYAGCDDGVYYWNKPLGCWIKMTGVDGQELNPNAKVPNFICTRLRINYCTGKLIAASYGRGIWTSNLINLQPGNATLPLASIVINSNETWNADKYIEGSILIKSGKTLTIQGTANPLNYTSTTTVYMPKFGVINVEKGAKLIVDGAKITNGCDAQWYGIKAYGDGVSPQNMIGGYYPNQGYVEIKNNGILSNAEEAFTNTGGSDSWNTGGIINANKGIFLNNRRSCQFIKYENIIGSTLYREKSKFIDCEFILDANHYQPFGNHITMWAVRGIEISGCNFSNGMNLDQNHEQAIYTIDASFDVKSSGTNISSFSSFYRAIASTSYSWANNSLFPISITGASFSRNEISIQLENMLYPTVVSNEIRVGAKQTVYPPGTGWSYYSLGSYLDNVSHFVYCSNIHTKPYATIPQSSFQYTAGLEIHNSGPDDQQIEKNSYSDLLIGTDIDYTCGSNSNATGVNLRWNKNQNNLKYDFIFQANPVIRPIQSADLTSNSHATGNTFTNNTGVVHWRHDLGGNAPVNYFHSSGANEIPTNIMNVNPIITTSTIAENPDCEKYTTVHKAREGILTTLELEDLKNSFYYHQTEYLNYKSIYNQTIDEGNTEGTREAIENSTTQEAMAIRAEMLQRSPYVSNEVLQTLAEENILPQNFLLEILIANPEATRSESFLRYLEFEKPNPMPEYMINMIRASWTGLTLRSILENKLADHHEKMTQYKDEVVLAYKYLPQIFNADSLIAWMSKVPSLRVQYELIEYYLYKGNYVTAEAILNNLDQNYRMDENEIEEYNAYQNLYSFKKNLVQKNIEINQLDEAKIIELKSIADNSYPTFARSMARSALCFFYKICYTDPERVLPVEPQSKLHSSLAKTEKSSDIMVFPNPSSQFMVFEYNLGANMNEVKSLVVTDLTGKIIYSAEIKGNIGQHIWDVRNISGGNYIYNINTLHGVKFSGRISVKK